MDFLSRWTGRRFGSANDSSLAFASSPVPPTPAAPEGPPHVRPWAARFSWGGLSSRGLLLERLGVKCNAINHNHLTMAFVLDTAAPNLEVGFYGALIEPRLSLTV